MWEGIGFLHNLICLPAGRANTCRELVGVETLLHELIVLVEVGVDIQMTADQVALRVLLAERIVGVVNTSVRVFSKVFELSLHPILARWDGEQPELLWTVAGRLARLSSHTSDLKGYVS